MFRNWKSVILRCIVVIPLTFSSFLVLRIKSTLRSSVRSSGPNQQSNLTCYVFIRFWCYSLVSHTNTQGTMSWNPWLCTWIIVFTWVPLLMRKAAEHIWKPTITSGAHTVNKCCNTMGYKPRKYYFSCLVNLHICCRAQWHYFLFDIRRDSSTKLMRNNENVGYNNCFKAYLHYPDGFSVLHSLVKSKEQKEKGMSKSDREPCSGCSRIPVRKLGCMKQRGSASWKEDPFRRVACQSDWNGPGLCKMLKRQIRY